LKSEIRVIDLDLIDIPKERARSYQDEQSNTALEGSIQRFGLIQEIGVRPKPDGRYELIYGESRLRHLKAMGIKRYRVKIWHVDEKEAFLVHCAENLARGRPDPKEILQAVKKMIEEYGYDVEEIHRVTGLKRETIKRYAEIAEMPDEVISLIMNDQLPVSVAYVLRYLPREAMIRYAIQAATEGWTVQHAREVVQRYMAYMEELSKKKHVTEEEKRAIIEKAMKWRCYDVKAVWGMEMCLGCKEKIERLITIAELKCGKAFKDITVSELAQAFGG